MIKKPSKSIKKPPKVPKLGEIWDIDLRGNVGHEQGNVRPALVIAIHPQTKLATIIPLTSQTDAARFPYTLMIKKTTSSGLTTDSVVMIFQLRSCSYDRLQAKRGDLEKSIFIQVKTLVKQYLSL